jgi:Na+/H+-dicarboxylate symporter
MKYYKEYYFQISLVICLIVGGVLGCLFPDYTKFFKPLGDLFLNLILTFIIPLVFFTVSSAIAKIQSIIVLKRLFLTMMVVFILMGSVAALISIGVVKIFPFKYQPIIDNTYTYNKSFSVEILTNMFSVSDCGKLFHHQNILALVIVAIIVGRASHNNKVFKSFLHAGEDVMVQVFKYIMYIAPLGFLGYFSNLIVELGSTLLNHYLQISVLYYTFALVYFFVIFSIWIVICYPKQILLRFWQYISMPALTALGTCSSIGSISANINTCKMIKINPIIYDTTIPLGSILHKQGSIIGGIFKIAFIFSLYDMPFKGLSTLSLAIIVALLVGTIMGGIPSGGLLGECIILNVYGFPESGLVALAAFSIIIDPIATMLNVCGNTVGTILVTRIMPQKYRIE